MKLNKYTIILPILFVAILYLIGAFIAADFDIKNWNEFGRSIMGFLMGWAIIAEVIILSHIKSSN